MAPVQYYIPGIGPHELTTPNGRDLNRELLERVGLGEVWSDATPNQLRKQTVAGTGPDGKGGVWCMCVGANGVQPTHLAYRPEKQRWTQHSDRLWLGVARGEEPTAPDLARSTQISGHAVTLGDGNEYTIPVVRMVGTGRTSLPQDISFGIDGPTLKLQDKFRSLWDRTGLMIDAKMDFKESCLLALDGLSQNYRVASAEQNMLKLITSESLRLILDAMADVQTALELMEKLRGKAERNLDAAPP